MRTTDPSDRLADSLFSSLFPVSAIWSAICMIGSRVRRSPSPLGTPLSSSSENQRRDSNACRKRKSQSTQFCRRSKRIWSRCESWARVDYSRLFFPTNQFISGEWAMRCGQCLLNPNLTSNPKLQLMNRSVGKKKQL